MIHCTACSYGLGSDGVVSQGLALSRIRYFRGSRTPMQLHCSAVHAVVYGSHAAAALRICTHAQHGGCTVSCVLLPSDDSQHDRRSYVTWCSCDCPATTAIHINFYAIHIIGEVLWLLALLITACMNRMCTAVAWANFMRCAAVGCSLLH